MLNIDNLIKESIKNKDSVRTTVLRNIKTEFLNFEKENKNNVLTEEKEIKILNKIATRLKDSIKEYKKANRNDLVKKESNELAIVSEFLPKEPDQETVEKEIKNVVEEIFNENGSISMKDTKTVIETLKPKYPTLNGGLVSKIIQGYLKK